MENSHISWTHHTFNHIRGCTKVSVGCDHCYAETMSGRNSAVLGEWGKDGNRVIAAESYWEHPLRWNNEAEAARERRRVFCASLADVFEGEDTMPAFSVQSVSLARARLWQLIEATPSLDWLLLTKRPENIMRFLPEQWQSGLPANIWMGTSVENQEAADERIPRLLRVPAVVRFLSCEPLLGPVDVSKWLMATPGLDYANNQFPYHNLMWCIVGGESGANARPMHPHWARSLRDQCQSAGVPFFFNQWGEYGPVEEPKPLRIGKDTILGMARIGKKAAGRTLDGRIWDEFPEVTSCE